MSPDSSTVAVHDAGHGCEADTGSLEAFPVKTLERREELFWMFGEKTDAVIAHRIRGFTVYKLRVEADAGGIASAREFPGVAEQIRQNVSEQGRVARSH